MGLRFRKSVTLCKGVKLNFSKSGTSITLGQKGFRKTISSTGKVTTTIGIPGTGIYYTDTKKIWGKHNISESTRKTSGKDDFKFDGATDTAISARISEIKRDTTNVLVEQMEKHNSKDVHYSRYLNMELLYQNYRTQHVENNTVVKIEDELTEKEIPWDYGKYAKNKETAYDIEAEDLLWTDLITVHNPDVVIEQKAEEVSHIDIPAYFNSDMIKEIYTSCDQTILWKDIMLGAGAADLYMNQEKWDYCKCVAEQIINKNVDTYLKIIEDLKPVDDLLLYGGEFDFGTDDGRYIETEFRVFPEEVLEDGVNSKLLSDYIFSVSLRVARDIMAMLPIEVMIVHAVIDDVTVLSVVFERDILEDIDFRNSQLIQIITRMPMRISSDGNEVERISFDTYKKVPILEIPEEIKENVANYEKSIECEENGYSLLHRKEEELIVRAWNHYGMSIFSESHMQELKQEFEVNNIEFREMSVLASLHSIAGYYWEDEAIGTKNTYKEENSFLQNNLMNSHPYRQIGRIEYVRGHYRYRNGQMEYVRAHYRRK